MSVEITSFGYLHDDPPKGHVIDLRDVIRDPHVNPELRQMTGLDQAVRSAVLATPGAGALIGSLYGLAISLVMATTGPVRIGLGCQGGRHRSVVVAEVLAAGLEQVGLPVQLTHRDVEKPVVRRSNSA